MKLKMKFREFIYISNLLSFARILLAAPVYYLLHQRTTNGNLMALGVLFLAALTDALDGRLARKLGQKSELGRVLDPVADKICIGVVVLSLLRTSDLPFWFVIMVLIRDVGIVVLGMFMSIRTNRIVESNMLGKITVTSLSMTTVAFIIDIVILKRITMAVSVVLLLASSMSYFVKLKRSLT